MLLPLPATVRQTKESGMLDLAAALYQQNGPRAWRRGVHVTQNRENIYLLFHPVLDSNCCFLFISVYNYYFYGTLHIVKRKQTNSSKTGQLGSFIFFTAFESSLPLKWYRVMGWISFCLDWEASLQEHERVEICPVKCSSMCHLFSFTLSFPQTVETLALAVGVFGLVCLLVQLSSVCSYCVCVSLQNSTLEEMRIFILAPALLVFSFLKQVFDLYCLFGI